jgi:lipoprotein-releasing system permease protein
MYRYYLALRFMLSRPINGLAMAGVALGVWALIVVVSIFEGYGHEVRRHAAEATADAMVLGMPDTADYEALREVILADPNVAACAPRLVWAGLIHPREDGTTRPWIPGTFDESGRFVTLNGIDPAAEAQTTGFAQWLDEVEHPARRVADPAALGIDGDWMLLGTQKLETLDLSAGDDLTRMKYEMRVGTLDFDTATFRLAGGYRSHHAGFDTMSAYVGLDALRKLLAKDNPGYVNEIAIKLRNNAPAVQEETCARLQRALNPAFHARADMIVRPSSMMIRRFLESVQHQASLMKLVLFVIMVVAGFLIFATMTMMVTEKTHDIGVLAALGATSQGVLQVFLTCGLAISLVGTAIGIGTGWFTAAHLDDINTWMRVHWDIDLFPTHVYNLPRVPYHVGPAWIGVVTLGSLAIGALSAAIPARRAMRHDPLDSLRNA